MCPRRTAGSATANTFTDKNRKDQAHNISANSTAQIGNSLRTRVAYNNTWGKREGLLPAQTGADVPHDALRHQPHVAELEPLRPGRLGGQADLVHRRARRLLLLGLLR